ncbi:hypothetical protein [Streptomyces sp. MB09-02B]|uniref:hypothetical protein n=1 Tax=Streptomyces sp. MB09-02B TaxID=3028667 RepID=UPI0029BEE4A9|nr:hypothetical protein [Streptomyces sp. MB09-02B]MDX3641985.1 hypothetical protein [Streptomyces sp. MB09-02B]
MAKGWARRLRLWLRLPPGDVAAAAVLLVAMTAVRLGAGDDPDASPPVVLALGAVIAGGLAVRRRVPLAGYAVGTAGLVVEALWVVAVIDWQPWWGPVSWRKPVAFGVSFGLLVWSVVWITRQLPARWWVWVPAGLIVAVAVCEVGLITAQRWRGVASHFNQATDTDSAIWSVIGTLILPLILGLVWLFVAALGGSTAAEAPAWPRSRGWGPCRWPGTSAWAWPPSGRPPSTTPDVCRATCCSGRRAA